jgi:hypothetical protein
MAATDIGQLTGRQLERARLVFDIACEYFDRDPYVLIAALTVVNDESSFRVYANDGSYAGDQRKQIWGWYGGRDAYQQHMLTSLLYPHDAVAGSAETTKDSVNLTQFREMYGYAGYGPEPHPHAMARMMDPDYAVRVFIDGVPGRPGIVRSWLDERCPKGLTIPQRIQWVQGSEFLDGNNYAEAIHVALQLIDEFGGLPDPKPAKEWLDVVSKDEFTAGLQEVIGSKLDDIIGRLEELKDNRGWCPTDPEAFVAHVAEGVGRNTGRGGRVDPGYYLTDVVGAIYTAVRALDKKMDIDIALDTPKVVPPVDPPAGVKASE